MNNAKGLKLFSSIFVFSFGDALRFLHTRNLIQTDFLLIPFNVIANFSLEEVWNMHIKRKDESTTNIIT